jgi:tetraacyldisaccharide 4'-kinase
MRAPAFWNQDGLPARLLSPLGALTAAATARRVDRLGWEPLIPVFCCGNATMGGAGKTTVALDLVARLIAHGRSVHILTRGYGGRVRGLLRVNPALHDAALVGDEPLLLAQIAPVWVGANRAEAARAALKAGAEVLVMDDGLQNPTLAGRHNALVIDGGGGFGNARLFPAGPLREPVAAAAGRCDLAILIGPDDRGALAALPPTLPVLRASLVPVGAEAVAGQRVHAFAGIGRPEKFFASLTQAGAVVICRTVFPDHHRYTANQLDRLLRRAARENARPVTTPKDAVRIPAAFRAHIDVVGVALNWERPAAIELWLNSP